MSNNPICTGKTYFAFRAGLLARWSFCLTAALIPSVAQTYTDLYTLPSNFLGESSGPLTEVIPGIFFGASQAGIFAVSGQGGGKVLHAFAPGTGYPVRQLLEGSSGLLYGVANGGGNLYGYLFTSDLSGNVTTIDAFVKGTQSAYPVVEGIDLNLYGIEAANTNVFYRGGLDGGLTALHTFNIVTEGAPAGPVIQSVDGDFYGISYTPYSATSPALVYKITRTGVLTPVYAFSATVGQVSNTLMRATNGNFYGVTWAGGCGGTIYSLAPSGTFTTLASSGICQPAGLMEASDGNLYGADIFSPLPGGGADPYGSIFRMTLSGSLTTVFIFASNLSQGSAPAALVQGSDGKLYGVTSAGIGTAFSLDLGLPKPQPIVSYFYPTSGNVGAGVVIVGVNLVGATAVNFNGVPARYFAARGSNYAVAVVPAGAASGPVTVTTANGSVTSKMAFTVQ